MWYLPEPDGVGHQYGPQSQELHDMVQKLDHFLGTFLDRLEKLPHYPNIHLIVTSDHGMGATSSDRYVDLKPYIKKKNLEYMIPGNPVVFIQPKKNKVNKIYNKLKDIAHIQVTKNLERPEHWHYNNVERAADLVVVADSSWSIGWDTLPTAWHGGTHGYDPINSDMHAIFYAMGPALKKAYVHPTFENVDIYNLIAHLLNIKPAPNDGNFERVKGMLRE
ncbi:phosphoglycerol transferase [Saccharicrinis fermentans DSM 9555 = JCM 21142]|uniref:Phosphoglycerol transferase n=1 Tax=Saccharicrinis fermentans DSM 9555 = JCM 21142 TaxID=869213 RepID=W7XY05_9BACT|nr:phosphoglycerol transferase [Saccharicrinis fermentans DSM 9555 = JCM 21142]